MLVGTRRWLFGHSGAAQATEPNPSGDAAALGVDANVASLHFAVLAIKGTLEWCASHCVQKDRWYKDQRSHPWRFRSLLTEIRTNGFA